MILCQYNDKWFLSTGINQEKGICWLRCGPKMPHDETFQPLPPAGMGGVLYGYTDHPEEVIFYPEIYYAGMKVWPQAWDWERSEPILRCLAMPNSLEDLDSDYFRKIAKEIGATYPSEILRADGWEQIGRGEYIKYIHVDDLEKIEGPPPEGPF